jgi:MarR family transcriptional regulator, temperature-dependent positive regulator of motility
MPIQDIAALQRIGWLFREINVHFREEIEAELVKRKVGLTFSQVSTLSILSANPGINGAQLARRNMVTPQAMTGVLRELSSRGLLDKRAHPDSLRADSWHLTTKGETQLQRGRAAFAEITARMLETLGKADVGKLEGYLTACSRSLT